MLMIIQVTKTMKKMELFRIGLYIPNRNSFYLSTRKWLTYVFCFNQEMTIQNHPLLQNLVFSRQPGGHFPVFPHATYGMTSPHLQPCFSANYTVFCEECSLKVVVSMPSLPRPTLSSPLQALPVI